MKYFKAIPIAVKPYINWSEWASNLADLTAMGENDNPLILPENEKPAFISGVCPLKIVGGELVARTSGEMAEFEAEYVQETTIRESKGKIKDIEDGTFTYSGNTFPMHEAARLRYLSVANITPSDQRFMKMDGTVVTIAEANLPAFLDKFYKEILVITNV